MAVAGGGSPTIHWHGSERLLQNTKGHPLSKLIFTADSGSGHPNWDGCTSLRKNVHPPARSGLYGLLAWDSWQLRVNRPNLSRSVGMMIYGIVLTVGAIFPEAIKAKTPDL